MRSELESDHESAVIVYDGECPFCSRYVKLLRLRETIGPVQLVDARDGGALVDDLIAQGIDLNEGMVFKLGDKLYHGDECVHRLALLSTGFGLFNRLNAAMFRSQSVSRLLYPLMRAGRNFTLLLLRKSKIATHEIDST